MLVCTRFIGQIGFLRETASSRPSQQGKKGRDEGVCSDSLTLSNRVRRWMGPVEVSSLLDGERATMANFGLATNLTLFFLGRLDISSCAP